MKILIAPDSFKGCLRSHDAANAIKAGLAEVLPNAEIITFPMADGGEGTAEALTASAGGYFVELDVEGPLGDNVRAGYGMIGGDCAVMDMAVASGIELLPVSRLNPMKASSFGTGQMILDASRRGVKNIIIGIGGSATVDGGAGMAAALGFIFRDARGEIIARPCGENLSAIVSAETAGAAAILENIRIRTACDVTNPLTGPLGAATIYAPQKGATDAMVESLESGLVSFAKVIIAAGLADNCAHPGDGAAGGLGFALRTLCRSEMVSGAELVIEAGGLESHLADADLVITGEGCTDSQTASGKLCAVIARKAAAYGVPTVVVSGAIKGSVQLLQSDFAAAMSISKEPCPLEQAIRMAPEWLYESGRNIGGIIRAVTRG